MAKDHNSSHPTQDNQLTGAQFINLWDLINIVRQRWIPAASLGLILATAFAIFFLSQEPEYQAEASMVVELNTENVVNVKEVVESGLQNSGLLETAMNTHLARLKSRFMAQTVVNTLSEHERTKLLEGYVNLQEYDDLEASTLDPVDFILGNMLKMFWEADSQVIRVSITHPNQEVAQFIVNRYVDLYIRFQLEIRHESTEQAVEFLDSQALELRDQLETEEQTLQSYRIDNQLVTVEQNQQIVTERLSDLSSALTKARVEKLGIESRLQQVQLAGEDLELIMNTPFIGGRTSVATIYTELQELRRDEEILSKTYLERHPKMIENRAAQVAVEKNLWRAIEQARQDFEIAVLTANNEIKHLETKLQEAEEEARRLEKLSIEYRVLERKVDAQRKVFDMVTSRYNETSIAQKMELTSIRILDHAPIPKKPVSPNKKKIGLASILIFGFIFIGIPFGMELMDNRLRTFADIERFVNKPVLGDVQQFKVDSEFEIAQLFKDEDPEHTEPFNAIYGSLRLTLGNFPKPLSLVITSSIPAEGKSVVISNLAQVFASHQLKTILVDCDLRRPSVHRYQKIENTKGILEWMRSEEALNESILADTNLGIQSLDASGHLYALTSGGSTKAAATKLENPQFDLLISRLKREFDVILFDTPPVGVFHDAALVAEYADHTIFVARQNATSRQKTRHSVSTMDRSAAPVLGVIFNGVSDLNLAAGYGQYNGSATSYGYKYQYGKASKAYANYYSEES